ncbi:MAG: alpha/beta hydrolase [Caldilineaceae bacterium]|nr:alpha/beta hydrolase [Caldilineaceae bacterium]
MPFTPVRDIEIYYERQGSGPRLLYINGTGGDLRRKPNVFDSPLAAHFDILAFDQRGLGQSSRPDVVYTMADYADDAAALLDAVGWESCGVMGVSFGGMVAQELALRHPTRVDRLVLACTSSGGLGGTSFPLHTLPPYTPAEKARWQIPLSDIRQNAEWQAANPAEFQALIDLAVEGSKVGAGEPNRQIGARRQLEARADHDTYDRLPSLEMPVFVCGGRYDGIASPANLEALERQIPNARLEFFEGGHGFLMQDARAYARVKKFLLG